MPECEAEERITQALYEMELSWGAGVFDYAKIRRILTGGTAAKCAEHDGTSAKIAA